MFNKLKLKSEFSRNVLTLMTGTTMAQAIPIAISPILTRLYTPEDFGVFALYIAIVNFIAIIVTGRYEMAIVLPKKNEDAINILALSLLVCFFIVFVVTVVIILFKENILLILNTTSLGNLLYLVPISIFLAGLVQSFNYWSNRQEYFKNISTAQISQSLTIGTTQPCFGYLNINAGLILGNIIGRFMIAFVLVKKFLNSDKKYIEDIELNRVKQLAKKHKDFPFINSLHALSDIVKNSGSVMLISSFFGSAILGFYTLSLRVLQVPIGIIGSALGQVLYKKFSTMHNEDKSMFPYVIKIELFLLLIALPSFGLLYFIAPELFSFVFGEKWRIAGEYSQILIPYLFMNFLISPISSIPIILGKQKEIFYISLVGNIIFVAIILLFSDIVSFNKVLYLVSGFMVVYYSFVMYYFYRILR